MITVSGRWEKIIETVLQPFVKPRHNRNIWFIGLDEGFWMFVQETFRSIL
jgi:hypothetical protein